MVSIKEELLKRKQNLQLIKDATEKSLAMAPAGSLRIAKKANITEYYHYQNKKEDRYRNGKYINAENMHLAYELAQKGYNQRVKEETEKQLKIIDRMLTQYKETAVEEIYAKLSLERKKIVKPVIIPNEEYKEKWESYQYVGKEIKDGVPEIYTDRGERVRSKSEKIIADKLKQLAIPYRYECPLELKNGRIIYPDFTLLYVSRKEEIYYEHLGMMDHPEYLENALERINQYADNGIFLGERLLISYETSNKPLNMRVVEQMLKHYMK